MHRDYFLNRCAIHPRYAAITIAIFCWLGFTGRAYSQTNPTSSAANVSCELGLWKPSSIDQYPSKPFKNIDGVDMTKGLGVTSPSLYSLAVKLGYFYWKQRYQLESEARQNVSIRHLSIDIKYMIVNSPRINPFATYGLAFIWGKEGSTTQSDPSSFSYLTTGFNVGAGLDFLMLRHVGIGVEYQYLYAKLKKKVGQTDNYSGPKFSLKLLYIF
jgi:opacity protein-like surface antigen